MYVCCRASLQYHHYMARIQYATAVPWDHLRSFRRIFLAGRASWLMGPVWLGAWPRLLYPLSSHLSSTSRLKKIGFAPHPKRNLAFRRASSLSTTISVTRTSQLYAVAEGDTLLVHIMLMHTTYHVQIVVPRCVFCAPCEHQQYCCIMNNITIIADLSR